MIAPFAVAQVDRIFEDAVGTLQHPHAINRERRIPERKTAGGIPKHIVELAQLDYTQGFAEGEQAKIHDVQATVL